jgi:tRNA 2-thiouridine synthesizing protein A
MATKHWNAGEAGCGFLAVGLKREIDKLEAGERLQVTAHNAGAPADVPAWCRIAGHALELAEHPFYVLRKEDH